MNNYTRIKGLPITNPNHLGCNYRKFSGTFTKFCSLLHTSQLVRFRNFQHEPQNPHKFCPKSRRELRIPVLDYIIRESMIFKYRFMKLRSSLNGRVSFVASDKFLSHSKLSSYFLIASNPLFFFCSSYK